MNSSTAFEKRVTQLGDDFSRSLEAILRTVSSPPHAPQNLARVLGLDKVFTSRLLKALRQREAIALVHLMPGPEPLRRLSRAAKRRGTSAELLREFDQIIERFEVMIRQEAGDRSTFGALLSAWLPTAREQLELRHRQAAYKAMSLIKGASAEVNYSAVLLHPSANDPERIDVVWVMAMLGLRRMRPGVKMKFTTRRIVDESGPRHPLNLDGETTEDIANVRLDQFCLAPPAPIEARRVGDSLHYMLGEAGFGPSSAVDIVIAELNRSEIPSKLPFGSNRRGWFFSGVATPSQQLLFDVFVHRDIYPGRDPEVLVYDVSTEGTADVNDPTRDIDLVDFDKPAEQLGYGTDRIFSENIPNYVDLIEHVYRKLGWTAGDMRGYRTEIEFPVYGSQVTLAFEVPEFDA